VRRLCYITQTFNGLQGEEERTTKIQRAQRSLCCFSLCSLCLCGFNLTLLNPVWQPFDFPMQLGLWECIVFYFLRPLRPIQSRERGIPMLRITLKTSDRVLTAIPRFNRFLSAHGLSVVRQEEDWQSGSIQLVVNARLFGEVKMATKLAEDFFDSAIISVGNDSIEWMSSPMLTSGI